MPIVFATMSSRSRCRAILPSIFVSGSSAWPMKSHGPGGDEAERLDAVGRAGEEHVAGDLLLHEPGVGLVVVERADDVVAVGPGVRPRLVLVVAVRVAVVDDVEPVPRPALAVVRRREQPVDQLLVGVGVAVRDERVDLLRRRRQADQVEVQPADQRAAIRLRRRRQSPLLKPCG